MFDQSILNDLIKTAMKSTVNNKHSAVLIKNNTIYKSAYNKFIKEITVRKNNNTYIHYITVHAEINAVYSNYNKKNVKGMDILVIRVDRIGAKLKNSRPCNNCICKLKKIGIRKVFYSNEKGDIVFEYVNNMEFLHISSGHNNLNKRNESTIALKNKNTCAR